MNIMTKRGSEDNIVTYEHYCDTKADLANIPQDQITLGSVAIVLKDEDDSMGIYLANSNKEWISFSTGGSGSESSIGDGGSDGDIARLIDGTATKVHNSNVSFIRENAFAGFSMLSDISFPNVETIGSTAFYGSISSMWNYETSSVGELDTRVPIVSAAFPKCKTINGRAFQGCYKLSEISFPNVETIEYGVFQGCPITEAVFPKCISIASYVFTAWNYEPTLQILGLPAIKSIPMSAFQSCSTLTSVDISECENIGDWAFQDCSQISRMVLPKCTYLYQSTFAGCTSLSSLYMLASSVAMLSIQYSYYPPFRSSPLSTTGHIYVRASLAEAYKEASGWSAFSSNIVGMTDEEIAALDI